MTLTPGEDGLGGYNVIDTMREPRETLVATGLSCVSWAALLSGMRGEKRVKS